MNTITPEQQIKLQELNTKIDNLLLGPGKKKRGALQHKIANIGYDICSLIIEPLLISNGIRYRFESNPAGNAVMLTYIISNFDRKKLSAIFKDDPLIKIREESKSLSYIVWLE